MMKQQWEKISSKVDAMTMRERLLVLGAGVVLVVALINTLLLDPVLAKQKALRDQVSQQQQLMTEVQIQIAAVLQENSPSANTPQRLQLNQIRQEMAEGDAYLKSSRERLVQPEKMAEHLRQLLNRNNRLQLVALQTLPVTPLLEQGAANGTEQGNVAQASVSGAVPDKQVFKHGVQLKLRGNYLDLLQYLSALERLPQQMFWASAQMNVVQYPTAELTLILYTLSLDKTWLQI
jgi:MSHA biogenesis protein MshJ